MLPSAGLVLSGPPLPCQILEFHSFNPPFFLEKSQGQVFFLLMQLSARRWPGHPPFPDVDVVPKVLLG